MASGTPAPPQFTPKLQLRPTGDPWSLVSKQRAAHGTALLLQSDVNALIRAGRRQSRRMQEGQEPIIRATLDPVNRKGRRSELLPVSWTRR